MDPQFRAGCSRPRGPRDWPPQGAASPARSPGPPPPPSQPSPAWALVSPLQSGLFMASAREAHRSGAEVTSAACTWREPGRGVSPAHPSHSLAPSQEGGQCSEHLHHRPGPGGCGPPPTRGGPTPGPCLKLPAGRAPALGARGLLGGLVAHLRTPRGRELALCKTGPVSSPAAALGWVVLCAHVHSCLSSS